jgi:hypothetical protein
MISTKFNQNPLSISLLKQFNKCVAAIVHPLNKLIIENPYTLNFVDNDTLIMLNAAGYTSLPKFYKIIFKKYERIAKFCDEAVVTP